MPPPSMFVTVFPEKVELLTVMMPRAFCIAPPVLLAMPLEKVLFSTVTVAPLLNRAAPDECLAWLTVRLSRVKVPPALT